MPKISVSPTESRNSSIPYSRPFRAWATTPARRVRRSPGQRAAGARVPDLRDPVDDDVGQLAADLPHLADVDEGLDHVLGPRVEPEAAARAVELDPAQGLEQPGLVAGVAAGGRERMNDHLCGVVALYGEAVGSPRVRRPEGADERLVGRVIEQRRVEVAGDDPEGGLALGGEHVGLGEEARTAESRARPEPELVVLADEADRLRAGEERVHRLRGRLVDLGQERREVLVDGERRVVLADDLAARGDEGLFERPHHVESGRVLGG